MWRGATVEKYVSCGLLIQFIFRTGYGGFAPSELPVTLSTHVCFQINAERRIMQPEGRTRHSTQQVLANTGRCKGIPTPVYREKPEAPVGLRPCLGRLDPRGGLPTSCEQGGLSSYNKNTSYDITDSKLALWDSNVLQVSSDFLILQSLYHTSTTA